jgi:hypothetical protein
MTKQESSHIATFIPSGFKLPSYDNRELEFHNIFCYISLLLNTPSCK